MKIGLITGLLEEADSFRPDRGRRDTSLPYSLREDDDFVIACAGIGKVHASIAACCLIDRGCELLVSLGVAGALKPVEHAQSGPFWLTEAVQHDYGAMRESGMVAFKAGTLPFGDPGPVHLEAIDDPGLGLPTARILTGDSFVESEAHAMQLSDTHGATLVDMETGAIAQVAHRFGVGWAGIRCASDSANADSVSEFRRNLRAAAERSAREADRLVEMLA